MAFLGFEQIAVDGTVKNFTDFTLPSGSVQGADLQAMDDDVRYTMDGSTDPAAGSGMVLQNGLEARYFDIDDIRNIRFTQASGAAELNVHYVGDS